MERRFFVRITTVAGVVLVLLGAMGVRALRAGAEPTPHDTPGHTVWSSQDGGFDTETGDVSAMSSTTDTPPPVRLDVEATYLVGRVDLAVTLTNGGRQPVTFDDGVTVPVRFTGTRPDGSAATFEVVVRDAGLRSLAPGQQAQTVRRDVPFPERGSFGYTGRVSYR